MPIFNDRSKENTVDKSKKMMKSFNRINKNKQTLRNEFLIPAFRFVKLYGHTVQTYIRAQQSSSLQCHYILLYSYITPYSVVCESLALKTQSSTSPSEFTRMNDFRTSCLPFSVCVQYYYIHMYVCIYFCAVPFESANRLHARRTRTRRDACIIQKTIQVQVIEILVLY